MRSPCASGCPKHYFCGYCLEAWSTTRVSPTRNCLFSRSTSPTWFWHSVSSIYGNARRSNSAIFQELSKSSTCFSLRQAALQRHADFWADKIAPRLSGTLQSFYIQLMFWSEFQSSVVGPPFSDTWLSARLEQFSLVSM